MTVDDVMELAPVIPVLVVERTEDALPIAQALVAGGLRALEVTLRTENALDVIKVMSQVEGAVVGAGTVVSPRQLEDALKAGARFIVSPGFTSALGKEVIASNTPYLPGVATASDIMRGMDLGLSRFKFFPAETSGGIPALKALAAPFYDARFCPTGGITEASAADWLDQPFTKCVGGSWVVPKGPINTAHIKTLAKNASSMKR